MANTFLTPSQVVMDAALFLADNLLIANLANRSVEAEFAKKVGQTVTVKVPPTLVAKEKAVGVNTSASDLTQTSTDVVIEKHFYQRVDITTDELTFELDDFNTNVTLPAVRSIIAAIENYALAKIVGGFNRNIVGTAGTDPSTHAHILAAEKAVFAARANVSNLVSILTGTAWANLAQLKIFTSSDFGDGRPAGLMDNTLGKLSNINFFRSPYADSFDRGDIAGTVLVNGDPGTASVISMDAFTAATGTVREGTRFTAASDTSGNTYTVTADTAITGNAAASIPITPAADASIADNDAVTFETAPEEDVVYDPKSVAGAILPGARIGHNVAVANVNGVGIRIIENTSVDSLATSWVFDLYTGFRVVKNEFGVVMQGS